MKNKLLKLSPAILILLIILIGLYRAWYTENGWLDIIKTALSWPVLVILLIYGFLILFDEPIRLFLSRITHIEAPGLKILSENQKDMPNLSQTDISKVVNQRNEEWLFILNSHQNEAAATIQQINSNANDYINELQFESFSWRVKFADLLFVPRTKLVLKSINLLGSITYEDMDSVLLNNITQNDLEKQAIVDALSKCEFIKQDEGGIHITPFGKLYAEYLHNLQAH